MADATVLKTVGLNIRTGSSPVSGTIRKPKPAERSTGFDFTTAKFTAKLFILPLFLLFVILILWKQHIHFRRCVTHRF